MDLEKLIVLLVIVVVFLIIFVMYKKHNEKFDQVDICDFNSPDPSQFCKSIKKGCTDLIHDNNVISKDITDNCTKLPTNQKDLIDVAINCDDATNKKIMNEYVQKEVCSQIKNFPTPPPEPEILSPSSIMPYNSNIDNPIIADSAFLPFDSNESMYATF